MNTEEQIFLATSPSEIEPLRKELYWEDVETDLIKSGALHKVPREYSTAYFRARDGGTMARALLYLRVPPLMYWIATVDPDDDATLLAEITRARQAGHVGARALWDAVLACARKRARLAA
ncbi:MAG: hypothetical protein KatS3mg082_1473 [Nitrospiraceae bacterium]|nr:MAG: hypothetical protein KatS3mg082_1473 [Nitrospiraceae bacterium]